MKWNVGTKIGAGFGLALLVFVMVGAVSYRSTTQLVEAANLRKHTYEVLERLTETLSLLQDMEIGQRSYILVGELSYLEPYRGAVDKMEPGIQALRKLTEDTPRQQQRLDALEPVVKDRLAFAKESIDLYRSKGYDAALQLVKTGRGKALMDDIRKIVAEMKSDENALLQKRAEAARNDADNAKRTSTSSVSSLNRWSRATRCSSEMSNS